MEQEQNSPLINELTQGKELANQLKHHLDITISPQTCEVLVEKILSSYEKALSLLNWSDLVGGEPLAVTSTIESSPGSDISDPESQDSKKNVLQKRKTMPRWSEQVKVCAGTAVEGPLSDGYSWRKYGQKNILGANFPRAYYRCTHRNIRGCLATKQVQRSDEDPSIFKVTYRGRHTCIQSSHLSDALASVGKESKKQKKEGIQEKQTQEMYFHRGKGLKPEEEGSETSEEIFSSFSFPSTPLELPENVESLFFVGSESPCFFSHAQNLQSSYSDPSDLISAPNSGTNSPMVDWEFLVDDHVDFSTNDFPFEFLA